MKIVKFFILLITLNSLTLFAQTDESVKMEQYAAEYAKCESVSNRLQLANKFFAYLRDIESVNEPEHKQHTYYKYSRYTGHLYE